MRVAVLTSGFLPVIDGVTVTIMHRLRHLSTQGRETLVLCPDYSCVDHIYPDWRAHSGRILPGVTVTPFPSRPCFGIEWDRNPRFGTYRQVRTALAAFQPDVIHVDEPERLFAGFLCAAGTDYARRYGIPCFCQYHTNYLDYADDFITGLPRFAVAGLKRIGKTLLTSIYNTYDATLISSRQTLAQVEGMGIRNAVYGQFCGFDETLFGAERRQPEFFERRFELTGLENRLKVVAVGRLTPDKGWHFMMKALPHLMQQIDRDTIAILVAGDGELRDEIARRIGTAVPHLHFLGRVPPSDMPGLLAQCDIYITASEKETLGMTVIEALASGLAVLAPRAGGILDTIKDGLNGLLFAPRDMADFLSKLKSLIEDDVLRQRLGLAGPSSVRHLAWDRTVRNWLDILDRRHGALNRRAEAAGD